MLSNMYLHRDDQQRKVTDENLQSRMDFDRAPAGSDGG